MANLTPSTTTIRTDSNSDIMNDDNELSQFLNSEYERRRIIRDIKEREWMESVKFINGDQYDNSLNGRTHGEMKWHNENKYVHNKIRKVAESIQANLIATKRVPIASPLTNFDKDIRMARITNDIIKQKWKELKMDDIFQSVVSDVVSYGNVFIKTGWDWQAGRTYKEILGDYAKKNKDKFTKEDIQTLNEAAEKVGDTREGDISVRKLNIFSVYPDNINRDNLDDNNSIMVVWSGHYETIDSKFGVNCLDDENIIIEEVSAVTQQDFNIGGTSSLYNDIYTSLKNQVIIKEFYQRPNNNFPNGKYIVAVSNKIVINIDLPFKNGTEKHALKERDFPIVHITTANSPKNFYGDGLIKDIIPFQKKLNAVRNLQYDFLEKTTHSQWLVQNGSLTSPITNKPGGIIRFKTGTLPPTPIQARSMSQDSWQETYTLNSEIESGTNINRVNISGEGGSQLRSQKQQQMASEQGSMNMQKTRINIASGLNKVIRQHIRIYKTMLKPNEKRHLHYSAYLNDNIDWNADLLVDNIKIESESAVNSTVDSRRNDVAIGQAAIRNTRELNGGRPNPAMETAVIEAMEFGLDVSTIIVDKTHTQRVINEHNYLIEGISLAVDVDDDHEIHREQHVKYKFGAFTDRYQRLSETGQFGLAQAEAQMLEAHIREHVSILERMQKMQEIKMAQMQK